MKKVTFVNSWADTYAAAQTDVERCAILLIQAARKNSKRLIVGLLEDALSLSGGGVSVDDLVFGVGQTYSEQGLRETARLWAENLGYSVD